ncbi:MAG TPA: BamA/TamA family outer membrane protein [Candidatus Syntrophosphaera sp.]|nr:BamA/TamA family outer membrane protein [Candidatus Cloacimonadota bacterium]HOR03356.1 BamA/TamA family outer membrane protein [Candidatus Syntrophosphaera sp.]HQG94792.1 BamA/TamA family outer membrane protein [Candidatus Syntrophosphaera sp.]HQK29013.1 BamA/TamA family outer membrane protein [Candidatus Syntrophosphaera sp.]HQO68186.1 BamA/TamA family outer membrane protein [Candidatus Syntrophosphaera sp.]
MKLRYILLLLLLLAAGASPAYYFGQNKVNLVPEEWSTLQTMHFDIYYPRGEDEFGRVVALMAEETYYTLKDQLTFPIGSRIPVMFYSSKTNFQSTNIIYPLLTEGVGGFTESLRNRVAIPFDGSYSDLEELLAHELTHAYTNALEDGVANALRSMRPTSFPFWFSEGLPEYLSIGGESDYNNMFILDMVVNDKLPPLQNLGGYYAYRLGESFLAYLARSYGKDKVTEYYYTLRSSNGLDNATKKVFGLEFDDLESRWRYQLKRDFYPLVESQGIPVVNLEKRSDSKKKGAYFNLMPRFSPDGSRYVWFSSAESRYSVWMGSLHGLSEPRRILKGEATGKIEEFHYFRSNLSWFPDNRRVAFAAKTANGDRIHILDVDRRKIVRTIAPAGMSAIYELDVAPDGRSLVFAGQQGMRCDLFLMDMESENLTRITDDLYNDLQPRFTPDGQSVVFASERSRDPESRRRGLFANLNRNIFSLDLAGGELTQHTFEKKDCSFPQVDAKGQNLYYINSDGGVSNIFALDLKGGGRAKVTSVLSGVYSADLSPDSRHLLLANYFDGAWDIYFKDRSLDTLCFSAYPEPRTVALEDSLLAGIDLGELDRYGKREAVKPRRVNPAAGFATRDPFLTEFPTFEYTAEDSLLLQRDFSYDDRPQTKDNPPVVKPYRARFSLDSLWGGLAYSPAVGTIGYVELSMSDMMGDHGIGINAGVSGKLEESNLALTYLYLRQRMDYGIGVFNLNDEYFFREVVPGPNNDIWYRYRERQSGGYFLLRYPFSRFLRLEFDQMVYQRGSYLYQLGDSLEVELASDLDLVYSPGFRLVHDNALYGSTGPLLGWRLYYDLNTTINDGKIDYVTNYLDWRSYTLFSKRYSIALRGIAGISTGPNHQRFSLGGYYGIRAYGDNLSGSKKAVLTAELRFPFFEYIDMAFPLPLTIPNIRGSIFAELGTVFDDFDNFQPFDGSKLKDLKLGYGFGPRLDLGYVILALDVTWLTDLETNSKPTFYISLSEDF